MLGLVGLVIGVAFLVLTVYHWDLIDKAFVNFMEKIAGI